MSALIGKKVGMTQTFSQGDALVPITVVQAGPCPVLQIKRGESDGYSALRLCFGEVPPGRVNKPSLRVFERAGVTAHKIIREFRLEDTSGYAVGDVLAVSKFEPGEKVDVTGRSKGKGFQGTVKRHHFRGGPKTHGQSDRHRAPGSVGQSSFPSRVFKGMRMAGHMGSRRVTVKGLSVVGIDEDRDLIYLKGAVPGARGDIVVIQKQGKA